MFICCCKKGKKQRHDQEVTKAESGKTDEREQHKEEERKDYVIDPTGAVWEVTPEREKLYYEE